MDNGRSFKGVWIPKEIWLDENLTILEKVILVEIDSLDTEETGCIASNEYLANFCNCTETKVSLAIKKLKELDLIEQVSFDGRKRILKSCLSKNYSLPLKKLKSAFNKVKAINIDNNIDININNNNNSIFEFLEQNFARTFNPIEIEEISTWEDNDLTRYAIKKAVLNNKCNINYISKILYNYKKQNIMTVQDALAQEEQYQNKKKYNNQTKNKKEDSFMSVMEDIYNGSVKIK